MAQSKLPKRIYVTVEDEGKGSWLSVAGTSADDISESSEGNPTGIYELVETGTVTSTKQFVKKQ